MSINYLVKFSILSSLLSISSPIFLDITVIFKIIVSLLQYLDHLCGYYYCLFLPTKLIIYSCLLTFFSFRVSIFVCLLVFCPPKMFIKGPDRLNDVIFHWNVYPHFCVRPSEWRRDHIGLSRDWRGLVLFSNFNKSRSISDLSLFLGHGSLGILRWRWWVSVFSALKDCQRSTSFLYSFLSYFHSF